MSKNVIFLHDGEEFEINYTILQEENRLFYLVELWHAAIEYKSVKMEKIHCKPFNLWRNVSTNGPNKLIGQALVNAIGRTIDITTKAKLDS